MRKILVTGGAGNIGGSLVNELVKNPDNFVVVVDNLLTGSIHKLPPSSQQNFKFIKADVNHYNEIAAVMLSFKFDYVYHYAALVGVQRTLNNPTMVLDDIGGIKNVLNLAKNTGVKRVFYSSSSEVYGEPVEIPQHEETTPLNSRLPYAIVKNVGEAFFKSYYQEYGLEYTLFRFFNTYGPSQSLDFVVPRFLSSALKNEPITVYGEGSQTRTFCYVADNMELTIGAMEQNAFVNDTVNVGNDEEMTVLELAQRIIAITGSSSEILHLPALKEGDMLRRKPDITKMLAFLKRDLLPLDKGLEKMLESRKFH